MFLLSFFLNVNIYNIFMNKHKAHETRISVSQCNQNNKQGKGNFQYSRKILNETSKNVIVGQSRRLDTLHHSLIFPISCQKGNTRTSTRLKYSKLNFLVKDFATWKDWLRSNFYKALIWLGIQNPGLRVLRIR